MKLSNIAKAAVALIIATTGSASADQFAIQTDAPIKGASQGLLDSLHVREIDAVEINGAHFMVVDARDEGFVEAYIYAQNIDASALYRLEADWAGAGLSSLPVEAREAFFEVTLCEFCKS